MRVFTINSDNTQYGESITGSLSEFQEIVKGDVQAIDLRDDLTLWINEEGKLDGLPYNHSATLIWEAIFGKGTDIIVGNAFFTGGVDNSGNTLGISDEAVSFLKKTLATEAEKFISDHIKIISVGF
jgi:hypothetical protein